MIRYDVMILPDAEEDIRQLADYIALQLKSRKAALDFIRGIRKMIHSLEIFPQRFAVDEDSELAALLIRKTFFKNYNIYFLVDEVDRSVYILHVFHVLRDSKSFILKIFNE